MDVTGVRLRALSEYLEAAWGRLYRDSEFRVLFVVFALHMAVAEAYGQALPLLFGALGLSAALLGVALSLASAVEVVLSPLAGVVSDAADRLTVTTFAVGLLGIVLGSFLVVSSAAGAVALVVLYAVGNRFFNTSAMAAVNETLEDGFEGFGWGVRDVGLYLGGAVGVGAGGVVVATFGDVRFVFGVLVVVVGLLGAVLWRASDPGGTDRESDRGLRTALARWRTAVTATGVVESFRAVSEPWTLARLLVVDGLVGLGVGMSLFLLPLYAAELGIGAGRYLLLFSGSLLLAAPLSLVGGVLADAVEQKWLYVGNATVEAAMLFAFALTGSARFFLVGLALYVIQTAFEPAVVAYIFGLFDDDEGGRVWSLDGMVSKAIGAVAPAVGGFLFGVEPRLVFLAGGVLTLAGALVATTMPRRAVAA